MGRHVVPLVLHLSSAPLLAGDPATHPCGLCAGAQSPSIHTHHHSLRYVVLISATQGGKRMYSYFNQLLEILLSIRDYLCYACSVATC